MFWSKKKSIIEQIREREAKEKEWEDIPVVGARSPEQKAEIEAKRIESANEKELQQPRKEREKEEKAEDGLKLVIDTAKLECKLCRAGIAREISIPRFLLLPAATEHPD